VTKSCPRRPGGVSGYIGAAVVADGVVADGVVADGCEQLLRRCGGGTQIRAAASARRQRQEGASSGVDSAAARGRERLRRRGTTTSLAAPQSRSLRKLRGTAASQRSHKTQECMSCRWQARQVGLGSDSGARPDLTLFTTKSFFFFSCVIKSRVRVGGARVGRGASRDESRWQARTSGALNARFLGRPPSQPVIGIPLR
jgi:hypothetical protein